MFILKNIFLYFRYIYLWQLFLSLIISLFLIVFVNFFVYSSSSYLIRRILVSLRYLYTQEHVSMFRAQLSFTSVLPYISFYCDFCLYNASMNQDGTIMQNDRTIFIRHIDLFFRIFRRGTLCRKKKKFSFKLGFTVNLTVNCPTVNIFYLLLLCL